jgi:hypothetical protein
MQFLIPSIAYAEEMLSIKQLMFRVSYYIINPLIIFGFVVALIYFIWGIIDFLRNRDNNAEASNDGKQHMLWGTFGMVIMVSAFAIMRLLANVVGAGSEITSYLP